MVSKINLHLGHKNALLCVVAFTATFLLISFIVSTSVGADLAQLIALYHSNYDYSATVQSSTLENTYYQYNAGISFTQHEDSKIRINAEVLMQTEGNGYSDKVCWNVEHLDSSCVAISKGIADHYKLTVGDVIYSKHIADGVTRAYTIEKLLPPIETARVSESSSHFDGVIIMGYDALYAANISYTCIVFSNEPIDAAAEKCSEMPTDILYRNDEIAAIAERIAPYLILFVLFSAACVVGMVILITKSVAHNFKRLAASGAGYKLLNRAFYTITVGIGLGIIIVSGFISALLFGAIGNHAMTAILILCAVIGELIALLITATASNRRLWRN